jgi:hypothetical protein
VHAVLDVHEMPLNELAWPPGGLGVFWIDQLLPFHRSANFTSIPALFW